MRTIEKTVYHYHELAETAKARARDWYAGMSDEDIRWAWEDLQADAQRIGLKLTAWDYGRYAQGQLTDTLEAVCLAIHKEHGTNCETYKTATDYLAQYHAIVDGNEEAYEDGSLEDALDELEAEFLRSLLEDYRILMDHDADYRQSEEYLAEQITANEYEFDETGKRV